LSPPKKVAEAAFGVSATFGGRHGGDFVAGGGYELPLQLRCVAISAAASCRGHAAPPLAATTRPRRYCPAALRGAVCSRRTTHFVSGINTFGIYGRRLPAGPV